VCVCVRFCVCVCAARAAALGAYRQLWSSEQTAVLDEWRAQGEPVISLRAKDQAQMWAL
jgi:peptidyl-tRNA hydrolase